MKVASINPFTIYLNGGSHRVPYKPEPIVIIVGKDIDVKYTVYKAVDGGTAEERTEKGKEYFLFWVYFRKDFQLNS